MAIKFPDAEETMRCPYHGKDAAFCTDRAPKSGETQIVRAVPGDSGTMLMQTIRARFCRTCGYPVIEHLKALRHQSGVLTEQKTCLYPVSPRRDLSARALPKAIEGVAKDYDEAVNCEAYSLQAAAFLLGRCVERILVDAVSEANERDTLGKIIADSIPQLSGSDELKDVLAHGFLIARNQAGHVWTSASGEELIVDDESVEHCFQIVQELHYDLYERPSLHKKFVDKMKGVLAEKKEGEKKDT